jgi:hypothetical protein
MVGAKKNRGKTFFFKDVVFFLRYLEDMSYSHALMRHRVARLNK